MACNQRYPTDIEIAVHKIQDQQDILQKYQWIVLALNGRSSHKH